MLKTHDAQLHAPAKVVAMLVALVLATCLAAGTGFAETVGTTLEQLKAAVATAQTNLTDAQSARESAQQEYEAAKGVVAGLEQEIADAQTDAEAKKGVSDAKAEAATAADEEEAAAQQAVDDNAADIAAAQSELEQAHSAKATATEAVEAAQQEVDTAQSAVGDATEVRDQAQGVIDAELPDPESNAGHKEWTAYGFFQYVRDNAPANSAAYWDAQCALDILDGGVNTTGHSYEEKQGPEPDGQQASKWGSIASNIAWDQRGDAVGLDNFRTSLGLVDEFNSIRGEENKAEGTNLRTDIKTNCRQMAISIVQCDTSKIRSVSHTQAYEGLENLSWSSDNAVPFSRNKFTDPYVGWYDEEKVNYKENNGGVTGHYTTIVDLNSGYFCEIVGAAVCNYGGTYDECREISTFGDFFDYDTNPTPEQQYSVADFSALFDEYYDLQVEAGMFGTTDEEKAANRDALDAAQANLDAAQANLDTAQSNLEAAQATEAKAITRVNNAQSDLETQQGKTAGLQEALTQAQDAATAAHGEADEALAAYETAAAYVEELQNADAYADAKADRDAKKTAYGNATDAVAAAETTLADARADLEAYTDLESNPDVTITVAPAVYSGSPLRPAVTVAIGDDTLTEGEEADYTVEYANNTNAGTASVAIMGVGDFRGAKDAEFTIDPATVDQPVPVEGLAYNGEEQEGIASTDLYEVTAGGTATAAGEHTATLELKDADNYRWFNGSAESIEVTWSIARTPISGAQITIEADGCVYAGAEITPDVSVVVNERTLVPEEDYAVEYGNNINAGTATVTVTGVNGYDGVADTSFAIGQAAAVVKPRDASKVFGEDDPDLAADVEGLFGSDSIEYQLKRDPGDNAGNYSIVATGEQNQGNYMVSFEEGVFTINAAQVDVPAANEGLVYNGSEQQGVAAGELYELSGDKQVNAGTYTATVSLKDKQNYIWSNGTADNQEISWTIAPKSLDGASVTGAEEKAYNGEAQTQDPAKIAVELDGTGLVFDTDYTLGYENNVNAGAATVLIVGAGNYTGTARTDFTINPKPATVTPKDASKVYGEDDPELTADIDGLVGNDSVQYQLERKSGEDVGTYSISASGSADQGNYLVEFDTGTFTIGPAKVDVPKAIEGLVYDGTELQGVPESKYYELTDAEKTSVGSYVATASLADSRNYTWSDGTTDDKKIPWSIGAATFENAAISGVTTKTYNGKAQTQNPTVKLGDKTLEQGTDYTLSYENNVNAGTATMIVTGTGGFDGTLTETFTIAKAANPMTAKAKAKTVKYAKAKKKAQAVKKAIVVSKAQGKVTYAKVAKGSSKKLVINKKTGKITVKKGAKKGTHKIKVKVTAAGNGNYNKVVKTVTVKVKVK